MRSDIRYLLAYSRPASIIISVALLVLAGFLLWLGAMLVTGESNAADVFPEAVVLLFLLLISCRLVV